MQCGGNYESHLYAEGIRLKAQMKLFKRCMITQYILATFSQENVLMKICFIESSPQTKSIFLGIN